MKCSIFSSIIVFKLISFVYSTYESRIILAKYKNRHLHIGPLSTRWIINHKIHDRKLLLLGPNNQIGSIGQVYFDNIDEYELWYALYRGKSSTYFDYENDDPLYAKYMEITRDKPEQRSLDELCKIACQLNAEKSNEDKRGQYLVIGLFVILMLAFILILVYLYRYSKTSYLS